MEKIEGSFYLDRINKAYQEQIWITAFLIGINGFIISNIKTISENVCPIIFSVLLGLLLLLVLGLILLKHQTYRYYYSKLRRMIPKDEEDSKKSFRVKKAVALYAGVLTYSLITVITTGLSFLVYFNSISHFCCDIAVQSHAG